MKSEQIRQAITKSNLDQIKRFIQTKSIDIEQRFPNYNNATIWHIAAEGKSEQHLAILKLLLQTYRYQLSSDILNRKEKNYLTPIHYAVLAGNLEAIRLLVSYGADPNLTNHEQCDVFFMLKLKGYGNLQFKLQEIIDNRVKLQEEVWQNGPTQIDELNKPSASIADKVTGLAKNISSFFQNLSGNLERKKLTVSHNELVSDPSAEPKKIR